MSIISIEDIKSFKPSTLSKTITRSLRLKKPVYMAVKMFCAKHLISSNHYLSMVIEHDLISRGIITDEDVDSRERKVV